ncbi:MAG: AbrB/MazE/SpoVT family DNA-binding domain-containing protein [Acidilobaceae archaeon]
MSISIVKRRVQKLGGSSLIVTLPKSWARRYGLDVGDTVIIVDEGDHIKIFPPDSRMIQIAESIRFKLPQYMLEFNLASLIDCLYIKGYKRFMVQLPNIDPSEVLKLVDEAKKHPRVRTVNIGFNELNVSFDGSEPENPVRFLKYYSTKIQELMDIIDQVKTRPADINVFDKIVAETVDIAKTISRTLRKHGITLCEAESVDPTVTSPLLLIPQILREVYVELQKINDDPPEVIRKVKALLLEVFGGLAGRSSKRIALSLKMADDIKQEVEGIALYDVRYAKLSGIIVGLILTLKNIGESTICENISREQT